MRTALRQTSPRRMTDMTTKEYRAIRESLELNQAELAEELGVAMNTISRRELGQVEITREMELALRYLADKKKRNVTN